jgi:hypothetical protein
MQSGPNIFEIPLKDEWAKGTTRGSAPHPIRDKPLDHILKGFRRKHSFGRSLRAVPSNTRLLPSASPALPVFFIPEHGILTKEIKKFARK